MQLTMHFGWGMTLFFLLWMLLPALLCLGGVALGGVLVFRTKKESFERIFGGPAASDETVSQARGAYFEDDLEDLDLGTDTVKSQKTMVQTNRFLRQMERAEIEKEKRDGTV
jgi:hypothetical protein